MIKTITKITWLILFTAACTTIPISVPPKNLPTLQNILTATEIPIQSNIFEEKFLVANWGDYYLFDKDGSQSNHLFVRGESPLQMASLSPDKTKFAYFKDNFLHVHDIQTQQTLTLNEDIIGSSGWSINWSPDNKTLAMSCANAEQRKMAVCLIESQSGKITFLINEKNTDEFCASKSDFIEFLDWSRDGSIIVYTCFIVPEKGQKQLFSLYLYNLNAKTSQKVFDNSTQDTIWYLQMATISPDNNLLLINGAGIKPISQIFILDLKTYSLTQLTYEEKFDSTAQVWRHDSNSFYLNRISKEVPYPQSNFIMNTKGEILFSIDIHGSIVK